MAMEDKLSNKAKEAKGKAKEATGNATGDEELRDEGRSDQSKADLKQAGQKAKDAFKH